MRTICFKLIEVVMKLIGKVYTYKISQSKTALKPLLTKGYIRFN